MTDMVNMTIDGMPVEVEKGTLLIRAAEKVGVRIPRFCDHPLLAPSANCRQCLVEVAMPGRDGVVRPMPKPQPSCAMTAMEGMEIKTQATSPVAAKAQDGTITVYGHIDTSTVTVGQQVMAGDQIATVGNRGFSTGPHLHFEVHLAGENKIDPLPWLASRGISLGVEQD